MNKIEIPAKPDGKPIHPTDIDTSRHFYDAFSNIQTEISAHYVVGLLQEKGSWEPFTEQEIEAYYQGKGNHDGFTFNGLVEPVTDHLFDGRLHTVGGGYIVKEGDTYIVTPQFIEQAFRASPKK